MSIAARLPWQKPMPKRVLIIGGYGNFGSYIARALCADPQIQIIIAGRSLEKSSLMATSLPAANPVQTATFDIRHGLAKHLKNHAPDIVIHTSGPFQGQDSFVARACIEAGCHYIDLADGRDFVCSIADHDAAAKKADLLVVSGASSVPGLSSCLIDHYSPQFEALHSVDYGITTAQRTNRGEATTAAVLSYAGKPFETLTDGVLGKIYGWQNLHRHHFSGLGRRWLGNCDVPDLALFPARYPSLKSLRFYAGLELSVLHWGLWALTWLVRLKLVRSLEHAAPFMLKSSFLFDRCGSDCSGFYMHLTGLSADGADKSITFDLIARSGHGPFIPCMPVILLAQKLVHDQITARGAMPCVGLLTLEEYLSALSALDIEWHDTVQA